MFKKIQALPKTTRQILFVASSILWFFILNLFDSNSKSAMSEAHDTQGSWLITAIAIGGLAVIFLSTKKDKK